MSAESIRENAIRKVIQELIVPDLGKIMNKQDILEERINSVKNELKSDIARLDERINTNIVRLDERINTNIARLDERIDSLDKRIDALDDKLNTKIDALSEKVDYMNKTNERLFNIIFHSTDKENNRPK